MIEMESTTPTSNLNNNNHDINTINQKIENIELSQSPSLESSNYNIDHHIETEDYSFTDEFKKPIPNSYRGIFVSCWDQIEPFEVYLSKDQKTLDKQISKLLQVPLSRREYIGKTNSSFFYFALFTISNPLDGSLPPEGSIRYEKLQSLPLNFRANSLKKKQKLKGDAIFINLGLDGIERDISLEQYRKLIDNLTPRQKVFDFVNNLNAKSDVIGTILYKPTLQFKLEEEDEFGTKKKNPTAILNEYKAIISSEDVNIFTTTFGGYTKPFYSTCTINNHTIYSKVFKNKADSIRSCHFRALRYLEVLQAVTLGHFNIDDEQVQNILNETYYSSEIDDQNRILENDTNYLKNKAAESIAAKKDIILDVLEKAELELGEDLDTDELFGVPIKRDHKVLETQNGKILIHFIKEVNQDNNNNNNNSSKSGSEITNLIKPVLGEEVKLDFIYYLSNGKIVDRKCGNFIYGFDDGIIDGLHYVISHMNFNEIALASIDPEFAYGDQGIGAIDQYLVPPNSTIGVLVELSCSKRNKPTPEQLVLMPMQQKVNSIKKYNELAKESFIAGLFLKAFRYYKISKGYCSNKYLGKCDNDDLFYEFQELAAQTLTNICICYEKMSSNEIPTQDKLLDRKMKYCHRSLDYCETSKAYRLRSGYYKELKQYQQALDDLISAKEVDQCNQNFSVVSESNYDKQIKQLTILTERYNKNESKTFQNYFNSENH